MGYRRKLWVMKGYLRFRGPYEWLVNLRAILDLFGGWKACAIRIEGRFGPQFNSINGRIGITRVNGAVVASAVQPSGEAVQRL